MVNKSSKPSFNLSKILILYAEQSNLIIVMALFGKDFTNPEIQAFDLNVLKVIATK